MITMGKTYQFKINGYAHQGVVKDVVSLDGKQVWITTTDGEDYILTEEDVIEV